MSDQVNPDTGEVFEHPKGKNLDAHGREIVSGVPVAPPVGYKKQPSMVEHIRNMVRSEMLRQAVEQGGFETFEEADDFEVGDDYDPSSPYEEQFEPVAHGPLKPVIGEPGEAQGEAKVPPTDGPGSAEDKSAAV